MKTKAIAILCLLITFLPINSWSVTQFTVNGVTARGFGNTTYILDALVPVENSPGEYENIRSELEFPLDANLAGVTFALDGQSATGKKWGAEVGFITNVGNPSSPMTDRDWQRIPGGFDGQISYIESDVDLQLLFLAAEGYYQIFQFKKTVISLLTNCSYQKISQDMTGFEGWRINYATLQQQSISGSDPIIEYEVTYISPQLGLKAAIELGASTALELKATGGFAFASDVDDHLLRGKLSEADAVGLGFNSQAKFRLLPGFALWRHLSLDIVARFSYFTAEGDQTQRWYQDEGSIASGTEIKDIPHEFESFQYTISMQIGFSTTH